MDLIPFFTVEVTFERFFGLSTQTRTEIWGMLIRQDEQEKFEHVLAQSAGRTRVVGPAELSLHNLTQLDRLVVTADSNQMFSDEITPLIVATKLEGVVLQPLEAALTDINPALLSDMTQLVRVFLQKNSTFSRFDRTYFQLCNIVEPCIAALLLLMLSPILLAVMVLVKITSPGPVFYSQTRVGKGGKPFEIYKFRSMGIDAEKNGPAWATTSDCDPRLTPIGSLLRGSHLDELPQLWNIVRGNVSFIGPRPERPAFVDEIKKTVPAFEYRTLVKPGVTGWAQVKTGYANSIDDSRRKLEFDLYYALNRSLVLDLEVALGTFGLLMNGGTEGRKREVVATVKAAIEAPSDAAVDVAASTEASKLTPRAEPRRNFPSRRRVS